jgi:hypothetical protein
LVLLPEAGFIIFFWGAVGFDFVLGFTAGIGRGDGDREGTGDRVDGVEAADLDEIFERGLGVLAAGPIPMMSALVRKVKG